jgi:hypothetical protein
MPGRRIIELLARLALIGGRSDWLAPAALKTDEARSRHQRQRLRIPACALIANHVDAIRTHARRDIKLDLEPIGPEHSTIRMLEHRRPSLKTEVNADQPSLVQAACNSAIPLGWNHQRDACSSVPPSSPDLLIQTIQSFRNTGMDDGPDMGVIDTEAEG